MNMELIRKFENSILFVTGFREKQWDAFFELAEDDETREFITEFKKTTEIVNAFKKKYGFEES